MTRLSLAPLVMAAVVFLGGGRAIGAPLDDARAALAARDLDGALRLAQAAVDADPASGEACLVFGLVHFHAKRYEDALRAFDQAARAQVPPNAAILAFNRGSAFFELSRWAEAERAFIDAATAEPRLAALATINAGLAALNAGARDRARAHAARVPALAGAGDFKDELGDLQQRLQAGERDRALAALHAQERGAKEALRARDPAAVQRYTKAISAARRLGVTPAEEANLSYGLGLALYRSAQHLAAAQAFEAAAKLQPDDADTHLMWALASLKAGDRAAARGQFAEALRLGLDADDTELARDYLDGLSPGLRAGGRGLRFNAEAGFGYDSNVPQAGTARTEAFAVPGTSTGGEMVTATTGVSLGLPLGEWGFSSMGYTFDQLAYPAKQYDSSSLQQHLASLAADYSMLPWLRLGLATEGSVLFTGLRQFTPFQGGFTVSPSVAVDEREWGTTRFKLGRGAKYSLDRDFDYFAGTRTDVLLDQEIRFGRARFGAALRRRNENVGTQRIAANLLPRCVGPCSDTYVIPYSYRSNALLLRFDGRLSSKLRLTVDGSVEQRRYKAESYLAIAPTPGIENRASARLRGDRRLAAGAQLELALSAHFSLSLSYDVVWNRSNIDNTAAGHLGDYDNKNYTKHALTLAVGADF